MLSNLELTQQWCEPREPGSLPSYTALPWGRSLDLTLGYILSLFCGCWPNPFPFSYLSKGKLGVPLIPTDWVRIFLGWASFSSSPEDCLPVPLRWGLSSSPVGGMRSLFLLCSWGTQSLRWPRLQLSCSQGCRDLGKSNCLQPSSSSLCLPPPHAHPTDNLSLPKTPKHFPLVPRQLPLPQTKASLDLINQHVAVSTALYVFRPSCRKNTCNQTVPMMPSLLPHF